MIEHAFLVEFMSLGFDGRADKTAQNNQKKKRKPTHSHEVEVGSPSIQYTAILEIFTLPHPEKKRKKSKPKACDMAGAYDERIHHETEEREKVVSRLSLSLKNFNKMENCTN